MSDEASISKEKGRSAMDSPVSVPLMAANVGLLVAHLAAHGVGFVGLMRREGLDVALGTIPVFFLLQVVAPVITSLAIASKFFGNGPNRNAAAVFAALLISLPCCTCSTLILPNVPKSAAPSGSFVE